MADFYNFLWCTFFYEMAINEVIEPLVEFSCMASY